MQSYKIGCWRKFGLIQDILPNALQSQGAKRDGGKKDRLAYVLEIRYVQTYVSVGNILEMAHINFD